MTKYSDLAALKEKIQSFGNEPDILKEREIPVNDTALPKKIDGEEDVPTVTEEAQELMTDIMDDFQHGMKVKDEEAGGVSDADFLKEMAASTEEETTVPETMPEDIGISGTGIEEEAPSTEAGGAGEGLEDLDLSDLGISEGPSIPVTDETPTKKGIKKETLEDMDLISMGTEEVPEKEASVPEPTETSMAELDALLGEGGGYTEEEVPVSEGPAVEEELVITKEKKEPTGKEQEKIRDSREVDNILEQLGKEAESYSDLKELDSLLGEEETAKSALEEREVPEETGLGVEEKKVKLDEGLEEPVFETKEEDMGLGLEGVEEKGEMPPEEGISSESTLSDLEDISSLEAENLGLEIDKEKEGPPSGGKDEFDLEGLDAMVRGQEKEMITPEEDLGIIEIPSVEEKKKPVTKHGEIPHELSKEEIRANEDVDIHFTEEERKKIVLTLTTLPKDAELKIAKAIVSGKYSNMQLKPLLDALLAGEKPPVIIRFYEKITGDRSLSQIEAVKYTGERFEEMQKSFSYVLQKNILPILSIIASSAVVVLAVAFLIVRLLIPTWQASNYYNKGKANIKAKIFWEVEPNFKKAFEIQPRYGEVVAYARLYRQFKRYLEAEKKYELAASMKPDDGDMVLEYADFFRETGDFERSEKKYKSILAGDPKNIDAMLGLARDYMDWSDEASEKLQDAKDAYYDVLDIDKKNVQAIFGKLKIYLKLKDQKEIMLHYRFIERNFRNRIDPYVYADLAEYFLDQGQMDDIKDILNRASRTAGNKYIVPQIDYQFSRYKKMLNITGEERAHLNNALSKFDKMKLANPSEYESARSQKLLSKVYNALGENYDELEKASIKAEDYFIKSIQADPYNGKAYYNLATFDLKYKANGYIEARNNYLEAESRGFMNDTLNYNLGWLYYRDADYLSAYGRINSVLDQYPTNSYLKLFLGTIFYRLGKFELAESMLLETYNHLNDLKMSKYPLVPEQAEDRRILEMLKATSNNLGAVCQKEYEKTRKSSRLISATKYYSDSVNYFDILATSHEESSLVGFYEEPAKETKKGGTGSKFKKENANINLRMVLYPDAGLGEPILYEDFPLDFMSSL